MKIEDIDMNALYLYDTGYSLRIRKISKTNTKSIRFEDGTTVKYDKLDSVYKLTPDEEKKFKQELIKELGNSNAYGQIINIKKLLEQLKYLLAQSEFISLDAEKLQKQIDSLTDILSEYIPSVFQIAGKTYKIVQSNEVKICEDN